MLLWVFLIDKNAFQKKKPYVVTAHLKQRPVRAGRLPVQALRSRILQMHIAPKHAAWFAASKIMSKSGVFNPPFVRVYRRVAAVGTVDIRCGRSKPSDETEEGPLLKCCWCAWCDACALTGCPASISPRGPLAIRSRLPRSVLFDFFVKGEAR